MMYPKAGPKTNEASKILINTGAIFSETLSSINVVPRKHSIDTRYMTSKAIDLVNYLPNVTRDAAPIPCKI